MTYSSAPDEEKLTSTIERFLVSNDPAIRAAAVSTLAGILDEIENGPISDEDVELKLVSCLASSLGSANGSD